MTPSFPSISTHSRPLYRLSLRINPCDTPSVMFITSRLSLHSPSTTPIQRHPMTSAYFTHSFSDPTNGHPDLRFFHLHPLHIVSFPRCKNTLLHLKPTALYSFTLFALHCINRHTPFQFSFSILTTILTFCSNSRVVTALVLSISPSPSYHTT